jgi:hypothetical protein
MRKTLGLVSALALGLFFVAWPVYAGCGKCVGDCKKVVKMMDDGKITLGKAIEAAEAHSKGKAVSAHCDAAHGSLQIEVFCMAGEKLMKVSVDGKTGKAGASKEVQTLGAPGDHDH